MKNRRQFPSLCRYFFLSYPTKKGGFLFLPVLQGFKTPARTPYIVKLYAKIFMGMFACPFSLQKSYPFFFSLFWVFSVFSVVFCIKKALRPFWSEKPLLLFYYIRKIFPKNRNQLRVCSAAPLQSLLKAFSPSAPETAKSPAAPPAFPEVPSAGHNIPHPSPLNASPA